MERWNERQRREILSCPIFGVDEVKRRSEKGSEGDFYVLRAPDWATVVPVTEDAEGRRCFLMVEQYRHGSDRVTIEFPAGTVDPGEAPETCARRELREETGHSAGELVQIGELSPNPAFMENSSYTYVARSLVYEGEQSLDLHESMHVHTIPIEEVRRSMGHAPYENAIMVAALMLFDRWERSRGQQ